MHEAILTALASDDYDVVERFEIAERVARYGRIPPFLFTSPVGPYLRERFRKSRSVRPLWRHQTDALEALGHGKNVVISTGTASGKSLVFRALALHKILSEPDSRVLVFYPLKALAADQIDGWQRMTSGLQLPQHTIGRIDGSVPVRSREDVLKHARIVVMTPDVCHAWFMSRLSLPLVRRFLRQLSTVVLDEAHTLEGVFGSSFAFLIRRMIAARNHLQREQTVVRPLQTVAATATIADPGTHLGQLTGSPYVVVDHHSDGSPRHQRLVAHVGCPDLGVQTARRFHHLLLANSTAGGFITFLDSRKGVEGLALANIDQPTTTDPSHLIDSADILPYRAGYSSADRRRIERRLRSGTLKGIVSTSALELGIDIPHLRVGFNVGYPPSRKAYLQRLGRVGRDGPGAFIVIAPRLAFRSSGTTFREYHDMAVEPSYLYLDNRFMQYAHARCLSRELEALGAPSSTPTRIAWPNGFKGMHKIARPGGNRPPEYDAIAVLGGDAPHYGYPLRNVGEVNFKIRFQSDTPPIGEVSHLQALRECYPGATYLHLTRAHRVVAWHTRSFEPFIRVKRQRFASPTTPRIAKWVNTGVTSVDICGTNYRAGSNGFLAESNMQITEKVTGYVDRRTNAHRSYKDLEQRNPNMRSYSRNFRTSGVVLCLNRSWFKGSHKQEFVDRLCEVFIREYSIAPRDIGTAATRVSVRGHDGPPLRGRCVCVYDEIYGSLRLTERLFSDFEHIMDRLAKAVGVESRGTGIQTTVARVRQEVARFNREGMIQPGGVPESTGSEYVFTPGSIVCYRESGQLAVDVTIVQPTMMNGRLMYQVEVPGQKKTKRWVVASAVEPSARGGWRKALWNREIEEYEEE